MENETVKCSATKYNLIVELNLHTNPCMLSLHFWQEIAHFLLADPSSSPVSRLEGLRLLRNSIVKNKNQLVELMNRTEGNSVVTLVFQVHLEAAGVNLSVVAVVQRVVNASYPRSKVTVNIFWRGLGVSRNGAELKALRSLWCGPSCYWLESLFQGFLCIFLKVWNPEKNIIFRMSSTINYFLCPDACGESTASPVADLVRGLISLGSALTTCDEDQAKVVLCEVANCLGDIGAVELSTVSLGSKTRTGNAGSFHTVH